MAEEIGSDAKQKALQRLLQNDPFASPSRLREFLRYIVEENIAGRGSDIRGKTIAQDVYGRAPEDGRDSENIVRVDARRLRQSLELYYQGAGRDDPVRLYLDTGSYNPRFESTQPSRQASTAVRLGRFGVPALLFVAGVAVGGLIPLQWPGSTRDPLTETQNDLSTAQDELLRRIAVYENSPTSLQATNLSEQARGIMFPLFDRPRQELVTTIFEHVIGLDPDHYGGYAGAAHSLATLAILSPDGPARAATLIRAQEMSETATRLAATEPWAQSARAWVAFADGRTDEAQRVSERAADLGEDDGYVLDFRGTIALFSGQFETAIDVANQPRKAQSITQRYVNRNIRGASNYHLGNDLECYREFEEAVRLGEPLSAMSLAYQAAALSKLGREPEALQKIGEIKREWPRARLDQMLRGIFADDRYADEMIEVLSEAGWSAEMEPG